MTRRISRSARRYVERYNRDLEQYFQKAQRIAMAKKRKQHAIDVAAERRARYYARLEMENGEETI